MIFGGRQRLYLPDADPEEFARKHGLEPIEAKCRQCGRTKRTTIPFYGADGIRGLEAPPCLCGSESKTYCLVRDPKHGDLLGPPR